MIEIRPVRGRRMTGMFLALAAPLYAGDPNWVPPLTLSARRFMSARRNPYFAEAQIEHFIAFEDGQPVGRISATIDPGYVDRYGPVGFFGWYESVNDARVAAALLSAAESWVAERGMTSIAGPYSYCSTQEFGLLVHGFDTVPAAFQPHNPPYYRKLIEGADYRESFRTDTYTWTPEQDRPAMEEAMRRAAAARQAGGFTVRDLDPARRDRDMDIVFHLFRASFAGNHDVIPMSRAVFDFQAAELRDFLDPRLIRLVERDGEPVAFSLAMADANEVLRVANGRLSPGFLLSYRRLVRGIRGTIVLMAGARPGRANAGVGRVLAGELARIGLGQVGAYRDVHTTWIHQENWQSRALVRRTGSAPRRSYAVLTRSLA